MLSSAIFFPVYLYEDQVCFDPNYGILGSTSLLVTFFISVPYLILNLFTITSGFIFCFKFFKTQVSRNNYISEEDAQQKEACQYVLISTAMYTGCSFLLVVCGLIPLSGSGRQLGQWSMLLNQSHGLLNILALFIALRSYRNKVKQSFSNLLRKCGKSSPTIAPSIEH